MSALPAAAGPGESHRPWHWRGKGSLGLACGPAAHGWWRGAARGGQAGSSERGLWARDRPAFQFSLPRLWPFMCGSASATHLGLRTGQGPSLHTASSQAGWAPQSRSLCSAGWREHVAPGSALRLGGGRRAARCACACVHVHMHICMHMKLEACTHMLGSSCVRIYTQSPHGFAHIHMLNACTCTWE